MSNRRQPGVGIGRVDDQLGKAYALLSTMQNGLCCFMLRQSLGAQTLQAVYLSRGKDEWSAREYPSHAWWMATQSGRPTFIRDFDEEE